MKGKIAFVLGAAAGYVLGTRAGRERYEQIKRGAQKLWETAPVQRGVGLVREAAEERVDTVKSAAARAGKSAFAAFLQKDSEATHAARPSATTTATPTATTPAPAPVSESSASTAPAPAGQPAAKEGKA